MTRNLLLGTSLILLFAGTVAAQKGEPCDTGLGGQCAAGVLVPNPTDGSLFCQQSQGPSTELCDGIDNDCNGLTDENDVCACGGIERCECSSDGECAPGYFCRRPVEECAGVGECTAIPVAGCTPTGGAVCGCDGRTYANDCDALLVAQSLASERACAVVCESCDPPGSSAGASGNFCRADCHVCGDGILDEGEQCDDGNAIDTDDCRNSCVLPVCGDLVPDPFESCDPPGTAAGASGNLCRSDCTVCGDGLRDLGEECDDNNSSDADACAGDCTATAAGDVPPDTLRVSRDAVGVITLAWDPSCIATDDDYGVYQGTLGDFAGGAPLTCSTGGSTSLPLPPVPGDAYFLVVPQNANREGSYGRTSAGSERPQGPMACREQKASVCPGPVGG